MVIFLGLITLVVIIPSPLSSVSLLSFFSLLLSRRHLIVVYALKLTLDFVLEGGPGQILFATSVPSSQRPSETIVMVEQSWAYWPIVTRKTVPDKKP